MMHEIPLELGMKQHLQPFILNMSLEEFWNAFYDDSAPFFVSKVLLDEGDELLSETRWDDPANANKDYILHAWDKSVISYRTYDSKLYVDSNPFSDHVMSFKNILLLEKTDTSIVIKELIETHGVIYSERFNMFAKWDIFTPDPKS